MNQHDSKIINICSAHNQGPNTTEQIIRFAKDFGAGWVGGIAQVVVGQPFDTIKIILQSQSRRAFKGPFHCTVETLKADGISGLYRGTSVPLLGIGLCVSIQFAALEQMKRLFTLFNEKNGLKNLSLSQLTLCGSVAGVANTIVSCPVEHIRIRLQAKQEHFLGAVDCIKKIFNANGVRGIFQGQRLTVLRDGMGFGAYFLTYEALMSRTMETHSITRSQIETWRFIAYGALAGISFWSVVFPIDVVKTRIQTDSYYPDKRIFKSELSCIRYMFHKEGISGFFRGFTPCFLRAAFVNAATFAGFEYAIRILN